MSLRNLLLLLSLECKLWCHLYFHFMLPSELLVKRKSNLLRKFNSCSSIVCHFGFGKWVKCVIYLFFISSVNKVFFLPLSFYILLAISHSVRWIKISSCLVLKPRDLTASQFDSRSLRSVLPATSDWVEKTTIALYHNAESYIHPLLGAVHPLLTLTHTPKLCSPIGCVCA